jgi:hypothetical protein
MAGPYTLRPGQQQLGIPTWGDKPTGVKVTNRSHQPACIWYQVGVDPIGHKVCWDPGVNGFELDGNGLLMRVKNIGAVDVTVETK